MGFVQGELTFRDNGGTVQFSRDKGLTWTAVSSGAASANCVVADWFGAAQNAFAAATGLANFTFAKIYENDFADTNKPVPKDNAGQGFQVAGTSTAAYTNLPGGVIQADASATGYADWTSNGSTGWTTIPNIRTKRWMVAYRLAIGSTPAAASALSAGIYAGSYIGIGYAGAAATWKVGRGATPIATQVLDTGIAIAVDATGATGYRSMAIGNFDLANWAYMPDLTASTTPVTLEAVSNLPNATAQAYLRNAGTDPLRYFLDKAVIFVEL